MKYAALIQARCGSSRLPNKVLKDLCGRPQLQWVIERVQRSKYVDEVLVVTSIEKANLPILSLCAELGVRVGVGSEEDVLDRYYQTAKLLQPEYVIRITGDCPCVDPEIIDLMIDQLDPAIDYITTGLTEDIADGLDVEIMRFEALEKSWKEACHSFEREHVTQYINRHPELFGLKDFKSPIGDFGSQRWTVDEPEDFEVVQRIFTHFVCEEHNELFGFRDIMKFMEDHPEIGKINQMYKRNEGLQKSIAEDRIVMNPKEENGK